MKAVQFCCSRMMDHAEKESDEAGAFERQDDGSVAVNGCCGGGCYVVIGMKFCPFCGEPFQ